MMNDTFSGPYSIVANSRQADYIEEMKRSEGLGYKNTRAFFLKRLHMRKNKTPDTLSYRQFIRRRHETPTPRAETAREVFESTLGSSSHRKIDRLIADQGVTDPKVVSQKLFYVQKHLEIKATEERI